MSWSISSDINEEYPYLNDIRTVSGTAVLTYPYPDNCYCTDAMINNGYPYLNWLHQISYCDKVKQSDRIILYNMNETDFTHFGIRILTPTSCKITEELNGQYELELEHPFDENGRMIDEFDIIKAKGQLFRIYRTVRKMSEDGSKSVHVNAWHIFYDLNARLLIDVRPVNKTGSEAINYIMQNTFSHSVSEHSYDFYSDITNINTAYYQNMSPVQALLGADNSFINRWGGEIYRDNFYFSINHRREHSKDNAFYILYGLNMKALEETIDYSSFFTYLLAEDNYGTVYNRGYYEGSGMHVPFDFCKKIKFNYDNFDIDAFAHDVDLYFAQNAYPNVNYKVTYADLSSDEEFKAFSEISCCEVGDTGKVKNERLDIETNQQIVKKVYDCVLNRTESIELGNVQQSLTRYGSYSNTISSGNSLNDKLQSELYDLKLKTLGTHINLENYTYDELSLLANAEVGGERI